MKKAAANSARAFTLIEVTLALGIFAFALISIVGLLPAAMKSTRDSVEIAAATQIANQIVADYAQGGFALSGSETYYFDDLGARTNGSGWLYRADVSLGSVVLEDGGSPLTDNLARLSIEVSSVRNPGNPHRFAHLLINQGQ